MEKNETTVVFSFLITLALNKTQIWREIHILGNQTLHDLHRGIFKAFGREREDLYSFFLFPPGKEPTMADAVEYTSPHGLDGMNAKERERHSAAETQIQSLPFKPGDLFSYVFDYGNAWWHKCSVEKVNLAQKAGVAYPFTAKKKGVAPPQFPEEKW